MLPIGDDNTDRLRTPFINYLLIAANIIVFIYFQGMGSNDAFTFGFATVPAEILTGRDYITESQTFTDALTGQVITQPGLAASPYPVWLTLITSMFMHGGWAHLGGNLLYLWVFGDNLESRLGHGRYLFFYLLTGVLAALSQVGSTYFLGPSLLLPSLGASGAISGILGGYLFLFPTRRVSVFVFLFIIRVPAFLVLGLWIGLQVTSGLGMLGGAEETGIAYAAHVGGFFAGLLLIKVFDPPAVKVTRKRTRFR